jgi:ADP-heptose:LPS heptosyltransferase
VSVYSNLTIPQLAALIGRARILVSNDTGPMHLGPALNVPTLGIFSVGIPSHFRPAGAHDRFVQGNPIDRIQTESVIEEMLPLWAMRTR